MIDIEVLGLDGAAVVLFVIELLIERDLARCRNAPGRYGASI
jgi:hypothetical protein